LASWWARSGACILDKVLLNVARTVDATTVSCVLCVCVCVCMGPEDARDGAGTFGSHIVSSTAYVGSKSLSWLTASSGTVRMGADLLYAKAD
jgi:hypothetical protein